ncbi:S-glutathionyl-(chloro)hydroquinone reductase [Friedmanniomyces endolithicus]|nr:S-glutathionyl-(chloro)hydroquinone reductase [Friedmanniomyces endolithicus]
MSVFCKLTRPRCVVCVSLGYVERYWTSAGTWLIREWHSAPSPDRAEAEGTGAYHPIHLGALAYAGEGWRKPPKPKWGARADERKGWRFATKDGEAPGENVTPDPIHPDFKHIRELYFENNKDYGGRFTVPTLYDKKQKRIVNNESSEIIRMFYHAFDKLLPEKYAKLDLLPEKLKESIEATNEWTYNDINNGSTRLTMLILLRLLTTQEAYEKNVKTLFAALDRAEAELAKSPGPYYHGADPTEADVRLYTTIIRFDAVYVQHFKCNLREIRSGYPALHKWVRYCYWKNEAFGGTTEFTHIKNHYTKSHHQINPLSITPLGPDPDILPMDEEVPAVKAALK